MELGVFAFLQHLNILLGVTKFVITRANCTLQNCTEQLPFQVTGQNTDALKLNLKHFK